MRIPLLIAVAAVAVTVPTAPASAVTTAAAMHVASGAVDTAAPSPIHMPRGSELQVFNAPTNPSSYTYVVTNGTYTYSTPGAIGSGNTGTIAVPTTAPPGDYRLTYIGGGLLARVVVL